MICFRFGLLVIVRAFMFFFVFICGQLFLFVLVLVVDAFPGFSVSFSFDSFGLFSLKSPVC